MYEFFDTLCRWGGEQLEVIGTVVGLVYLWLEYRASIYLWIASVVMPAIYIFIYYDAGLYADCGINVYYLVAAIYGWMVWQMGRSSQGDSDSGTAIVSILSGSPRTVQLRIAALAAVAAVLFAAMAWILIRFTDSTVPWLDSLTTALSIVAMWMLAHKYIEQWWVWIVVDVLSAGLYIYKELHLTAILYLLYAIIAIFGYRKWLTMMKPTTV